MYLYLCNTANGELNFKLIYSYLNKYLKILFMKFVWREIIIRFPVQKLKLRNFTNVTADQLSVVFSQNKKKNIQKGQIDWRV